MASMKLVKMQGSVSPWTSRILSLWRDLHWQQLHWRYHISLDIRQSFSFQYNPKNLDLSYKTDLNLWDCVGRVKLVL